MSDQQLPDYQNMPQRSGKTGWVKPFLLTVAGVVIAGIAGFAGGQYWLNLNDSNDTKLTTASADNASAPKSQFDVYVQKSGLSSCQAVFPGLARFLVSDMKYMPQGIWSEEKGFIKTLVGLDYAAKNYHGAGAGMVFAAANGEDCSGTMMRVIPVPHNCQNVLQTFPKDSKLIGKLGNNVNLFELGGGTGQAILLPASDNICVVMTLKDAAL